VAPVEKRIIELFALGDANAMDLLYDHYADTLYGIVFRMIADEEQAQDVLQEAFVKIWQHSRGYDPMKGRLFTWLLSITRNVAIDAIRKNKRQGEIYGKATSVIMATTEAESIDVGTNHDISKVLGHLSASNRAIIEHSYILGYTHPEIAEKFNIPLGTVKTRIRNAMIELRSIFGHGNP
jgi:RNA polymerase sigma factor (sigma-70 family)